MPLWGVCSVSNVEVSLPLLEQQWQCLTMYHGSKTFDMATCVISLCSCNHLACKVIPEVSCTTYLLCLKAALLALHSICRDYTTMIIWDWQVHHSFGLSRDSIACIDQHDWLRLTDIYQPGSENWACHEVCGLWAARNCVVWLEGNSACNRSKCEILSLSVCCL